VKVIHDAVGPLTDLASPLFEDERGAGSRSGVHSVDNEATAATEFPLCVLVLSWQFWQSDEMRNSARSCGEISACNNIIARRELSHSFCRTCLDGTVAKISTVAKRD
jgi:hypothetical protein